MLKFGMIGGGLGSYIGKFHCWGAMLDDSAELVFSPAAWIRTARPLRRITCLTPAACMRIFTKWQTRSPRLSPS